MTRKLPAWIVRNPVLPWGALFLLLGLMVTQYGGTNGMSRVAAMRAITEAGTLNIDNYVDWTIDWARAPDGRYYSNKAPGAIFLALPAFALTEIVSLPLARARWKIDHKGRAPQPGYAAHLAVMLSMQLVPFFLLVLWISARMLERGMSLAATHFFALSAFFGNTAAIYMNSNFGHGVSGLLFLAAFWCWLERRFLWLGVFLSWSLLSDYGVAFALPFFLLATLLRERNLRSQILIGLGASPGALIWIAYHVACFGSPFATANQFTNPEQISTLEHTGLHLWGEYSPFPSLDVVAKLLFGTSRGLLFTQPWVLAVFALPFLRSERLPKGAALVATGSLAGLVWMNGGFGGWHGGWCIGPRYLSVVFPALALALALGYDRVPPWAHRALWAALAVALAFRVLIYPFSNLAPEENIWAYHFRLAVGGEHRGTVVLRYFLALFAIGLAEAWRRKRARNGVSISGNPV